MKVKVKVKDLRPNGTGWQVRLHEKGGQEHKMPCHHALLDMLHAYVAAAGFVDDLKGGLFRTSPRHTAMALTEQPMNQSWSAGPQSPPSSPRRSAITPFRRPASPTFWRTAARSNTAGAR